MNLYLCEVDEADGRFEASLPSLPAERQKRIEQFYDRQSRITSIAAYLLLAYGLRETFGLARDQIRLSYTKKGKPYMDGGMAFNISHDGCLVACVVGAVPCGCDVMAVRPAKQNFIERFCSDDEKQYILLSKNKESAFTEVWTRKESLIKLRAGSVMCRLKEIDTMCAPVYFTSGRYKEYTYTCCTEEQMDVVVIPTAAERLFD